MDKSFRWPMKTREWIFGLVYIPLHICVVPLGIVALLKLLGRYDTANANFCVYAFGVLMCLLLMFSFLKKSFSDIFGSPGRFLGGLLISAVVYYGLNTVVNMLFTLIMGAENLINPNTEEVTELLNGSGAMMATTLILAPILEECLFRGALFGLIRRKSRAAAYIVTVLVFAAYHLWAYFVTDYSSDLWIYLIQYIAPTAALCYAYEKGGSIWCPILLHAAINTYAAYVSGLL